MKEINLEHVKQLLSALESEKYDEASDVLDLIVASRNRDLLHQVEEIADNLHETLDGFGEDAKLLQHTKQDLPDTTERLQYVIETTEQASNKTLSSAENISALLETLADSIEGASERKLLEEAKNEITEIMMAQSYQDLTGQVLNRVIMLVGSVEQSLVELIEKSGISLDEITLPEQSKEAQKAQEMKGLGPNVTQSSQKQFAQSQQDVDNLLDDLGI
ncbi:MAG: chemotaxis protein CheZ [Piscirickettsiaceae bacterium CG_4_9_14_3_um_filter_43_564]|nr:protein phosphatase CheZ [Thiomicrospira sp.]OIP94987.1 MAG: chemotaxis protein CheZ [Thiomicrospira sp. CG2_30_44_34]PIQ04948.1 MAG: chemotaxis protein CheZ [Piscirickettsiaceae bacterium CG18_big_fil_WC_8_21_14_2_50_44_103]PIU38223.1 MAG: chemotaxis protein CheZ [Piscirickettsiaceae bacterium CG07_land_8_20_14_0_80_44_28]PIW57326.1 MAG: chemotaxis protein CheZ [Piscirickettsiaceae bacterium CG12_big_fil_rev_8_21_14_0_65_44_934]PIW76918.1 MAG: chemotaxis protein CheZ [Piscirickettsiaceae b